MVFLETLSYVMSFNFFFFYWMRILTNPQGRLQDQPRGFKWTPWPGPKKKNLYIIFFDPYNKNLNTLTLNFLLNPIEISLNMILSFSLCLICIYVFLVFLYVRSSILISTLHIFKSNKSFTIYSNSKKMTVCVFKKSYTSKAKFYYWSIIFLSFTLTPKPNLTPKCVTITYLFNIFLFNWYNL